MRFSRLKEFNFASCAWMTGYSDTGWSGDHEVQVTRIPRLQSENPVCRRRDMLSTFLEPAAWLHDNIRDSSRRTHVPKLLLQRECDGALRRSEALRRLPMRPTNCAPVNESTRRRKAESADCLSIQRLSSETKSAGFKAQPIKSRRTTVLWTSKSPS